jgi:hypothetical protein
VDRYTSPTGAPIVDGIVITRHEKILAEGNAAQ